MLRFRYYCLKKALHISATPLRFLIVYVIFLQLYTLPPCFLIRILYDYKTIFIPENIF